MNLIISAQSALNLLILSVISDICNFIEAASSSSVGLVWSNKPLYFSKSSLAFTALLYLIASLLSLSNVLLISKIAASASSTISRFNIAIDDKQ